jgi:biofilm protein TabA
MLRGDISNPTTYGYLLTNQVWRDIFEWVRTANQTPLQPREDPYPIQGDKLKVYVQRKHLKPFDESEFESHRSFIDLQFCVSGPEVLYCTPITHLQQREPYDATKDLFTYHNAGTPEDYDRIILHAREFAVFFPADGHMPAVTLPQFPVSRSPILKLVFKISTELLPDWVDFKV